MKRVIIVATVLAQILASIAVAEEMPFRGNPKRFNQTLEGMSAPDNLPASGTMKGVIQTVEGMPLAGGDVYFFNEDTGPSPAPEKYWRVADKLAQLDDKGGFTVELPPGRYYIGAIQRKGDKAMIGPPSDGDRYYVGKVKYEVLPAIQNDLEVIKGAKLFSMDIIAKGEGVSAIEGLLIDVSGKPVENAMVFAHRNAEMNDKPLFVSERTDKNGAYRLRVAGSGTYYLRVRDIYGGGVPAVGSVMGVYGGNNPKAVIVKDGAITKGINLTDVEFIKPLRKSTDTFTK